MLCRFIRREIHVLFRPRPSIFSPPIGGCHLRVRSAQLIHLGDGISLQPVVPAARMAAIGLLCRHKAHLLDRFVWHRAEATPCMCWEGGHRLCLSSRRANEAKGTGPRPALPEYLAQATFVGRVRIQAPMTGARAIAAVESAQWVGWRRPVLYGRITRSCHCSHGRQRQHVSCSTQSASALPWPSRSHSRSPAHMCRHPSFRARAVPIPDLVAPNPPSPWSSPWPWVCGAVLREGP